MPQQFACKNSLITVAVLVLASIVGCVTHLPAHNSEINQGVLAEAEQRDLPPQTSSVAQAERSTKVDKAVTSPTATVRSNRTAVNSEQIVEAKTEAPAPTSSLTPVILPSVVAAQTTDLALPALIPESAPVPAQVPAVHPSIISVPAVPTIAGITGSMHIDFESRVNSEGTDRYKVNLQCANSLNISGNITRSPRVMSKILGREKVPLRLNYDLNLFVIDPQRKGVQKKAGVWSGLLDIAEDGTYSPNNLTIRSVLESAANPASGSFSGRIKGRADKENGIFERVKEYSRIMRGKKIALKVARVDPLSFDELSTAAGPLALYPAQKISGNLDYDYDTGNWLTEGIRLRSESGSEDHITGSIKWNEDPERLRNGRGQYEFNLRFNEERFTSAADEGAFFDRMQGEEAFFVVDNAIPTLSGNIKYLDTFAPGSAGDEPTVIMSDITYDLRADKLNKQQVCGFLKLWLLIVGPVNDE